MSRSQLFQRLTIAGLVLLSATLAYRNVTTTQQLVRAEKRIAAQQLQIDGLNKVVQKATSKAASKVFGSSSSTPAPTGPKPAKARKPRQGQQSPSDNQSRTSSSRAQKLAALQSAAEELPESFFVNHFYDAADRIAEQENWSVETFDAVNEVFDITTESFEAIVTDYQAGQIDLKEAKLELADQREAALADLTDILGKEGVARLGKQLKKDLKRSLSERLQR